jgi:hypothetical protein
VTNHHRDGAAVQLGARASVFDPSFSLLASVGPYAYFDTTNVTAQTPAIDAHGWGVLYSIGAMWAFPGPWRLQLRANRIETQRSIDTTSVVLGVGYRLDDLPASDGPVLFSQREGPARSSLALMLGPTVVNSFESEAAVAKSVEFRRDLLRYVDWSVAWLNEGASLLGRRNTLVTELWIVRPVLDERATIEAGAGPMGGNRQVRRRGRRAARRCIESRSKLSPEPALASPHVLEPRVRRPTVRQRCVSVRRCLRVLACAIPRLSSSRGDVRCASCDAGRRRTRRPSSNPDTRKLPPASSC